MQPTIRIKSIERNGTVVIEFSDDFEVPKNYLDLTLAQFWADGIIHSNLELTIAPDE